MHKLYDIKEILMEELETHAEEDLNRQSLEEIDTLAHALKNVCKIIECCDDEKDYSRDRGNSYGRRRDSMGRYSRDDFPSYARNMSRDAGHSNGSNDMIVEQLEQMVHTADDRYKGKLRELVREMRNG